MINMVKLPTNKSNLFLRVAKGHFATSHSHINYYIDVTTQKSRLSEAMDILKRCAGKRKQTVYSSVSMPAAGQYAAAMPSIPMNMEFGGVTVFVLDLERLEKF